MAAAGPLSQAEGGPAPPRRWGIHSSSFSRAGPRVRRGGDVVSYRTSFQCYIYACPEEQRPAAVRVLMEDFGFGMEFAVDKGDPLNLAVPYWAEETTLGTGRDVAAALVTKVPGASFVLWEDPSDSEVGPILGEMHAYTAGLGLLRGECDSGGGVVLGRSTVAEVVLGATRGVTSRHCRTMLRRIRKALDEALGGPWIDDWKAVQARRDRAAARAARAVRAAARRRDQAIRSAAQAVLDANRTTTACLLPGPENLVVTARRWIADGGQGWRVARAGDTSARLWVFSCADVPAIVAAARTIADSAGCTR
jgi:hypothetical protein